MKYVLKLQEVQERKKFEFVEIVSRCVVQAFYASFITHVLKWLIISQMKIFFTESVFLL